MLLDSMRGRGTSTFPRQNSGPVAPRFLRKWSFVIGLAIFCVAWLAWSHSRVLRFHRFHGQSLRRQAAWRETATSNSLKTAYEEQQLSPDAGVMMQTWPNMVGAAQGTDSFHCISICCPCTAGKHPGAPSCPATCSLLKASPALCCSLTTQTAHPSPLHRVRRRRMLCGMAGVQAGLAWSFPSSCLSTKCMGTTRTSGTGQSDAAAARSVMVTQHAARMSWAV